MATNIKVGIEVSDNGTTKKATEAAERLKNSYDAAGKSAKSIGVGGQAGGSKTAAGAMNRATTSSELVDYNRQRSVSVGTGASARDFAKQAEGLGGLVRLYATFAANVFAVTAAFNALSNAMDTTNMIKGMEQLGASTGVALGAVSKRLVETTNGAVSLREAMEATVKASSAGIDSSSILKLGKIAQQASVALGVNAADALGRLSRGVIKLEPELLDELAIFTKIDPAVKAYAKSVNKAEKDLTDFERRLAFLNAVIAEGQQKFSQIEIDTNPYTKLSATLKDVLQNTLELINKGLTPLVGFLANSPGVLTAGLTGIATILLRQALPAITKVKEGLRDAAESAADAASGKAGDAVEARKRVEQLNIELIEERIEKEIDAVDKAQKKIQAIDKDSINKKASVYRLLNKDLEDITDADIQRAERRAKQLSKDPTKKEEAEVSRQIIAGIKGQIQAEAEHKQARDAARADLEKDKSAFSVYAQVQRAAANAQITATKNAIVSNAAYNASLIGIRGSWALMTAEIKKSDLQLNILQSTILKTRAAFAIAAGAATAFANAISKIFFFIGIATTVISLVSSLFSTKEAEKFSSEIDNLNSVTENLQKTFDRVKNPFSQESLQAQSNALIEFSKSLENTFASAISSIVSLEQASYFSFARIGERMANSFVLGAFMDTEAKKIGDNLSASISTALGSARLKLPKPILNQLQQDLGNILDMEPADFQKGANTTAMIAERLKSRIEELRAEGRSLADDDRLALIAQSFERAGISVGILGSRIQEVRDSTKEADAAAKALRDTYKISNPIIDFARKSIEALEDLDKAQKDLRAKGDTTRAEEATKVVKDYLVSVGLDPSFADDISKGIRYFNNQIRDQLKAESLKNKSAFNEFARSLIPELNIDQIKSELETAQAELAKVRSEFQTAEKITTDKKLTSEQREGFTNKISQAQAQVDILNAKKLLAAREETNRKAEIGFDIASRNLSVEEKTLQISRLTGKIQEEALLAKQKDLIARRAGLELAEEVRKIDSDLESYKEKVGLLKDKSEEDKKGMIAAKEAEANSKKELATETSILGTKEKQLQNDLSMLNLMQQRQQLLFTILDLERQIASTKASSQLESDERSLNIVRQRSALTTDEFANQTKALAQRKLEQDIQEKAIILGQELRDSQASAGAQLADATLRGNKYEEQQALVLIRLNNEKYQNGIAALAVEKRERQEIADLENKSFKLDLQKADLDSKRAVEDAAAADLIAKRVRDNNKAFFDTSVFKNREAVSAELINQEELRFEKQLATNSLTAEQIRDTKFLIEYSKQLLDFEQRSLEINTSANRAIQDSQSRLDRGSLSDEQKVSERELQAQIEQNRRKTLESLLRERSLRGDLLALQTSQADLERQASIDAEARTLKALQTETSERNRATSLKIDETRFTIQQKTNELFIEQIAGREKLIEQAKLETEIENRRREIVLGAAEKRISLQSRLDKGGLSVEEKAGIEAQIAFIDKSLPESLKLLNAEKTVREQLLELIKQQRVEEEKIRVKQISRQIEDIKTGSVQETTKAALAQEEQRLQAVEQIGAAYQSELIARRAVLEQSKIQNDIEERRASIIRDRDRQIEDSQAKVAAGVGADQALKEAQLQEAIRKRAQNAVVLLDQERTFRLGILEITSKIAEKDAKRIELAQKLNEQYDAITSTAKILGDAFDGFGDRFAETVGGLSDVLRNDLEARNKLEIEYDEKRRIIADKYKDDSVKQGQLLREAEKENNEKTQLLDLQRDQQSIKSFKGLFKEKTTAYKALGALEKLMALQTLAINAKLLISNVATIASNVSAGVAKMFGQGGFAGFAGAAAFLALMGSLGVFKGGTKVSSGPSLEAVQESQLTGQTFVGNTLTTRAGALEADPTAKLESIDQSLQLIKTNSFDDLNFSNKSQKSLEKIEQNTRALAEQIAISLGGLTSNLPVGTRTTGPFGFGNSIIGGAASLATGVLGGIGGKFIGAEIGKLAGTAISAALGKSLGGFVTAALGPIGAVLGFVLGKNIDKVLNSVFGGKTTSTLKNVTLQLTGSLDSLSTASDEFVKTFATLEMKRKGGWFSSDRIWDEIIPTETPDILKEYVGTLFMSIKDSVIQAGEVLGQDATAALNTALSLPLDISLKDRKPEEIVEAIKNQVSVAFNEFAKAGFGSLIAALRDPLEEAGTTLTRLTTQVTLFDQAMKLIGKTTDDVTGTLKVVVADRLVELLGGVENFKDRTTFFVENFLSESEQIAPIAQELAKELNVLGISADITREQYKALVLQQDLSTDSGQNTYATLLNLAEAFDKVAEASEKTQEKLNGFLKSIRDFIRSQSLELVQPSQTTRALFQEFGTTVSKALAGDENSLSYLPDIASQTIESAKNSSASLREFNKLRAGIIGSLGEVANKIESGDLKILTPQEQTNVLLEKIEQNTANFSVDLAREIDKQQQIKTIVNDPELAKQALGASFAEAIQESGYDGAQLSQATLDFLEQEERDQKAADLLGVQGPRDVRMGAVGQLIGAVAPGGSIARIAEAIKTGDVNKLAPDLGLVSLQNLGIKTPSVEAIIQDLNIAVAQVKEVATTAIAMAGNAVKSVVNTVQDILGNSRPETGVAGGESYTTSYSGAEVSVFNGDSLYPNALGGAFNKGVKMFESGGAFSNSVVSNPTLFPLGVMGEAGPEAIMPLTRMGDGSLGVTAEVPVNNTNQFNLALLQEIKNLKKEMEKVRVATEVSATGTNKTYRLLDRVTENGDAFNVLAIEGSVTTLTSLQGGQY